jgi:DNA-binding CsgD family transcriptional regulator
MTLLTTKDREVLRLYAARMSTSSISSIAGGSEAAIYNRLTRLEVNSVGQALDRLRLDDEARTAASAPAGAKAGKAKPSPPPTKVPAPTPPVLTASVDVAGDTLRYEVVGWGIGAGFSVVDAGRVVEALRTDIAPCMLTDTQLAAAMIPAADVIPSVVTSKPRASATASTAVRPSACKSGGLRLKPVTDRIARWAGHFLRARWPLQEVADLFGVAEDDLAWACGVAA